MIATTPVEGLAANVPLKFELVVTLMPVVLSGVADGVIIPFALKPTEIFA